MADSKGMKEIDTLANTAEYLGMTAHALEQRRHRGEAPPAIKLAPGRRGALRFRKVDVDRWLDARRDPVDA
jgi:hypothetical protein